ncbi:MAG: hypothetical protein ACK40M_00705 [Flavobacteriales bacterium]
MQQNFVVPTDPSKIDQILSKFEEQIRNGNRSNEVFNLESAIWHLEGLLNKEYSRLDIVPDSTFYLTNQFSLNNRNEFTVSDLNTIYTDLSSYLEGNIGANRFCRVIDLGAAVNPGDITISFEVNATNENIPEDRSGRSFTDFSPGNSFVAYSFQSATGCHQYTPDINNAAKKINDKLDWRFNIAAMEFDCYFTNVTAWTPDPNGFTFGTSTNVSCNPGCLYTAGHLDLIWKGITPSIMLGYTPLQNYLNLAHSQISFLIPPYPYQVCDIDYGARWMSDDTPNCHPYIVNNYCCSQTYSVKFYHYYRWKYGIQICRRQ